MVPAQVGRNSKALEWCHSARIFRAEEALRRPFAAYMKRRSASAARSLAKEFVQGSSKVSNAVLRHMMWRMLGAPDPINAHWVDTAGINVSNFTRAKRASCFWRKGS